MLPKAGIFQEVSSRTKTQRWMSSIKIENVLSVSLKFQIFMLSMSMYSWPSYEENFYIKKKDILVSRENNAATSDDMHS